MYTSDLDNDNDIDVIVSSYSQGISWYENNGQGIFINRPGVENMPNGAQSLFVLDLDKDQKKDLIVASFSNGIVWFKNLLEIPTSSKDVVKKNLIHLYPNPFQDQIRFEWEGASVDDYTLILLDATGKILFKEQVIGSQYILHNKYLPKGLYFYQLINQQGQLLGTGKIIKQ